LQPLDKSFHRSERTRGIANRWNSNLNGLQLVR
jgi:hypothetical protein